MTNASVANDILIGDLLKELGEGQEDHSGHAAHDHSAHAGHHDHSAHGNMDHGGMDHAAMGHGDHGGHMMKMWFHGGAEEVILFDFWRINSCWGLLLSCLAIFAMGALYEGVKWFRVYLQFRQARSYSARAGASKSEEACQGQELLQRDCHGNGYRPAMTPPSNESSRVSDARDGPFSLFRIAEALLYSFQLVLAYFLMLIVMTYNTWLTVAVIAGAGFGHWLFAILNILNPASDGHDSFTTDACH